MLSGEASRTGRAALIPLRELALALVAVALGAAGCGDSGDESSADAPADDGTSLTVTLDPDGPDGPAEEMTEEVSCEDASDNAVCRAVAVIEVDALAPVSPDTACTQIFGGPDTASLVGTIDGTDVDADLTRANGCEIDRFDAALPLLQALYPDYEPGGALAP